MARQWYEKFRWFFTSQGTLVIGGKSAEQNEEVLSKFLEKDEIVMHTAEPGSPFAVIKTKKPNEKDLQETAVFTASFSRAWRAGKKQADVHIFSGEQITKEKGLKKGTFTVLGKIKKVTVQLKLAITFQNDTLRAVPLTSLLNNRERLCTIAPGKIEKEKAAEAIQEELKTRGMNRKKEEILNALPAGSFSLS